MKKMQKIFALILAAAMLTAVFAGCSGDPDDKGAYLFMYLAEDPSNINLDPAKMLFSSEAVKFIGLMFEGLTVMDDRGRLEKGMAKSWRIEEDEEREIYRMYFDLYDTKWSDGITVTADDFVFAWKRILQPDFHSPAAALLFDIKNARAVKEGEMTVDDLGIAALDLTLLEVTFERKIDYQRFLENVSSIALVPLRDDTVDYEPETWATSTGDPISLTLLSNGPFAIKTLEYNRGAMLERSIYYRLEGKRGENVMKFVKPYRLLLDFSRNLNNQVDAYTATINGTVGEDNIFFLGSLPADRFEEFKNNAEIKNMLSAYSIHFNANHNLFSRAEVRQALSLALDRNHIAGLAGIGVNPASGIVPIGIVGETASGADFRQENGELIPLGGDRSKAQTLLQSAGVSGGSFVIKVRNDDREKAVADYVAEVWNGLGFNVTVETAQGKAYSDAIFDLDYDVMLYDFQSTGVNAWSVLAPFAMPFSGGAKAYNPDGGFYEDATHITGFQNDAYDALIEEIFLIDDNKERHEKLKQAERMLVELSPVAPLYFNTSINKAENVSGITYSRFGFPIFTKAMLKNYQNYTTTEAPREFIQ
ncbi:MAG: ABC transporter substrate-binding protein [Oscillospiraceae bacterium]|nr:ABC transporter substrate-binding protein [Oscillospiraceae bacterium]